MPSNAENVSIGWRHHVIFHVYHHWIWGNRILNKSKHRFYAGNGLVFLMVYEAIAVLGLYGRKAFFWMIMFLLLPIVVTQWPYAPVVWSVTGKSWQILHIWLLEYSLKTIDHMPLECAIFQEGCHEYNASHLLIAFLEKIDHMLLECAILQESRNEYFISDSLNAFFETITDTCIVEFCDKWDSSIWYERRCILYYSSFKSDELIDFFYLNPFPETGNIIGHGWFVV